MVYVGLLRGINVGGKNKIDMKLLKETFVRTGMESVVTYINSGNVIFTDTKHTKIEISSLIQKAIYEDFQLDIKVLVRSIDDYENMMRNIPESWKNDENMKCDVLFIWEEIDNVKLPAELKIKPQIETVIYTSGAIVWAIDKRNSTKSSLKNVVGTTLYKYITIRNINTTRKIYEIMRTIK
jgi:uncharacterized protein (DUF1697 family)